MEKFKENLFIIWETFIYDEIVIIAGEEITDKQTLIDTIYKSIKKYNYKISHKELKNIQKQASKKAKILIRLKHKIQKLTKQERLLLKSDI